MDCDAYRAEISAQLDGEELLLEGGALDAHLQGCVACAQWQSTATLLHRAVRIAPAPEVPDLVAPILAAVAPLRPEPAVGAGALTRVARLALFAIGVAECVAALTGLFTRGTGTEAVHSLHELGAFDLALAVGFMSAALRPHTARALLPVVGALVAALAVVTVGDIVAAHAGLAAESAHLVAMLGLPLLWVATWEDGARSRIGPAASFTMG